MTQEEARKAAEVMMAYAEGKEIQFMVRSEGQGWKDLPEGEAPKFNFSGLNYRIKPEPNYRPFANKEECWAEMQKHHPFGWVKVINENAYYSILSVNDGELYEESFEKLTFADGTPFGIKEKQL